MVRYNPYLKPSGWIKSVHNLNAVIREVARDHNVLLLDLETPLAQQAELFRDPVHFTPAGHEEAARVLAHELGRALPPSDDRGRG